MGGANPDSESLTKVRAAHSEKTPDQMRAAGSRPRDAARTSGSAASALPLYPLVSTSQECTGLGIRPHASSSWRNPTTLATKTPFLPSPYLVAAETMVNQLHPPASEVTQTPFAQLRPIPAFSLRMRVGRAALKAPVGDARL